MTDTYKNPMEQLAIAVEKKKLEVVLPIYGNPGAKKMRVEARQPKDKKVIDFEEVKKTEQPEKAAERLLKRMTKDRVVE